MTEFIRTIGAIPFDVDTDILLRELSVRIGIFKALYGYRPPQLKVALTLFQAQETLTRAEQGDGDPTLGWSKLAEHGCLVVPVAGDHESLLESPHLEELVRAIEQALDSTENADDEVFNAAGD